MPRTHCVNGWMFLRIHLCCKVCGHIHSWICRHPLMRLQLWLRWGVAISSALVEWFAFGLLFICPIKRCVAFFLGLRRNCKNISRHGNYGAVGTGLLSGLLAWWSFFSECSADDVSRGRQVRDCGADARMCVPLDFLFDRAPSCQPTEENFLRHH